MSAQLVPVVPSAQQSDPVLAQLRSLRTLVWITPFITDGDTRAATGARRRHCRGPGPAGD
jgi:hypothetical protein